MIRTSVVIKNAPQLMQKNDRDFLSPISITRAKLSKNGKTEEIYLILLSGTKCWFRNVNSVLSCILCGLSLPNPYLRKVKNLVREHIPDGSKIVITGHSLGGMVAQQLAADRAMKKRYEILNLTCFGTPMVFTGKRSGTMHRLAERQDIIPRLSIREMFGLKYNIAFESGGYKFASHGAHNACYEREDVWGEYDCFGVKGGDAVICYEQEDMFRLPYAENSKLF